ncbi:MAG: TetR/AcrR family transcriptional regulator [Propionibacteriaceae bacterium]|jgi:AcrR family transcriptional regulator|nr:TetR/AcrR family transcriptional regulator [Propionibacteriaceae bacterium]
MPRVSSAYRQARRDLIARAAIACIERQGVHETSISDIVAESGLSTGAIYSHFTNKVELVRYIFSYYLLPRIDQLHFRADSSNDDGSHPSQAIVSPGQALHRLLQIFHSTGLPYVIFAQFWAEVTVDAELREAFLESVGSLQNTLSEVLLPWAEDRVSRGLEDGEPEVDESEAGQPGIDKPETSESEADASGAGELARTTTRTLISLLQGYIVNAALFADPAPIDDYVRAVSIAFSQSRHP